MYKTQTSPKAPSQMQQQALNTFSNEQSVPAGKKQNLISQLQSNQQQSMLYRLHQQQIQNDEHNQQLPYPKTQQQQSNKARSINQVISPSNQAQARINIKNVNMQQKQQNQTYNQSYQSRLAKQSLQIDGGNQSQQAAHVQSKSFQTPNIGLGTSQKKQKEGKQNYRLGSQEGVSTKLSQGGGYSQYKQNAKANGGMKRGFNSQGAHFQSHTQPQTPNHMPVMRGGLGEAGTPSFVQYNHLQTSNSNNNLNYLTEAGTQQSNAGNTQISVQSYQNASGGKNGPISIQQPHIIKVKSKTNANPTRKNSPQFTKYSGTQPQRNQLRESNGQKVMPKSQKKQSLTGQTHQPGTQAQNRLQVFSQPSSPNKEPMMLEMVVTSGPGTKPRTNAFTSSLVEPQIQGMSQLNNKIINQNIAGNREVESRDMKRAGVHHGISPSAQLPGSGVSVAGIHQATGTSQSNYGTKQGMRQQQPGKKVHSNKNNEDYKQQKGNSHKNLYSSVQGAPISQKMKASNNGQHVSNTSQRLQSGKIQQNFQNGVRKINSPNSNQIQTNQSIQRGLYEQQQKKDLNQAVSKKIGPIASGKSRRENRNQMMKNHQNQILENNNSATMGSMGSLAPFMAIESATQHENTQQSNLTAGSNQIHYSQLQQMHLNNLNPMFFSTGQAQAPNGQLGTFQSNQHKTMGGNHNPAIRQSTFKAAQTNIVKTNSGLNTNQSNLTIQQRKHDSSNSINQQQTTQNDTSCTQQPLQVKTSMIQMRKINPISRTTTTGSKNTSIDRKKSNSMAIQAHLNTGYVKQKANALNYKIDSKTQKQQVVMTGKPISYTTKVSYNNSPANRTLKGSMKSNQNPSSKRQQQQQPIGQPQGDIPLISNYFAFKQGQASNQNYQTQSNEYGQQKKYHQFAQSVLIGDNAKANQNQQIQVQQYKTLYTNESKNIGDDSADLREHPSMEQGSIPTIGQSTASKLAAGGKIKLKMMSETNSPPNYLFSSNQMANLNNQSRRPSPQNSQTFTQNKKGEELRRGKSISGPPKTSQNSKSSSLVKTRGSKKILSNQNEDNGEKYLNQYFKQQKHNMNTGNKYKKYAQIDSPKDGSIERVRHADMLQQEHQISTMNQQLGKMIQIDDMNPLNTNEDIRKSEATPLKNEEEKKEAQKNKTTEYIIKNIERTNIQQLSPRSKEVCLIKQLIIDCFKKYNKPPKTQLELYKIGKMLGKGAFGKVNLGLHRLTRKLVAIKSINMDFMKEESQKKKIMNEINILKSLRHPNNIKILETFQTDKHHMIVMELCPGGDLLNYVRKRRKLTEKYARFVFRQIMEGIAYLHQNKVAHRDIKLDNILLDGHGNIKLGDFGVSRKIVENEILFEQCGTPAYIAPEIVKDMGYKGFPVDIWSAGICLYAMLYGNVPFKANQIGDLNTVEQLNQEIEYKKDIVSNSAIELMKLMLQKVPNKRATAEQVLQHEWLEENLDEEKQIDIFDEQELELIRKEFTYVVQKNKLKEFREMKEKAARDGDIFNQASRMPDDLNTEFTECSIQTHENSLLKNDSTRSVILCPFNTQTGDKTADKIIAQAEGLMMDKDIMIRFHQRVRELDRNYEKLNNQDFDNGVYHKYAYKQKVKQEENKNREKEQNENNIKEEVIKQSDVQMNNLVQSADATDTARKRKRENADSNYHNYYVKINQNIINDTVKMGFPLSYVQKCLKENANNHCTTTYYLFCMDQNF